MTVGPTFSTEDCLNRQHNSVTPEDSGLNIIARQKFDLGYDELSPSLKSYVREEAARRAAPDMLATLKAYGEFTSLFGRSYRPLWFTDDVAWAAFVRADEMRMAAIALAEGK